MKMFKKYIAVAAIVPLMFACEKEEITTETEENPVVTKSQITTGIGGSMAQFTILGDYLYTVDYKTLNVFHIVNPDQPTLLEKIDLGIGIETIYPENDHLFIGTQDGVKIYDVTNPRSPMPVSEFDHVTACDPVIANDEYALATLRGGTECGGNLSELMVLDITDLANPFEVTATALENPYGLGFVGANEDLVYICDGWDGLKIYDISEIENPEMVMQFSDLESIDVIEENGVLVVLTTMGVYQFNAENPLALEEISVIPTL
ncbi:MAG: hypothetical protein MK078_11885 [Crocinitomicaceae bacterium]|nr:hypothetical protein [Crocinitomicaceae bacterium]